MSTEARTCKPFIRGLHYGDATELAETMRATDVQEVRHSSGLGPYAALTRSVMASDVAQTIEWQGRVMAIFGVVKTSQGGSPWMLGAPDLSRCRSLLREVHGWLSAWEQDYGYLANSVWANNRVHIEWIKWLGFIFEGESIRNGQTFLHFHRGHHV